MTEEIKILDENIKNKIHTLRGQKVMLDTDLAKLYNVKTKTLNQTVKRNKKRFPEDFMFQLSKKEFDILRSQIVTANQNWSKKRFSPYVFTEQGVATLSGILKSDAAIEVNIQIMRAFVKMRKFLSQNKELLIDSDHVYKKLIEHDNKLDKVFDALEGNLLIKKRHIFYQRKWFEPHKFISDLIKKAKNRIVLIDNYIDDSVLTLFSERNKGVKVTIYTKNFSKKLKLDLEIFNKDFEPVEIKKFKKSHDRFLIIDKDVYHVGASLKDLGKDWFSFSKFENEAEKMIAELE